MPDPTETSAGRTKDLLGQTYGYDKYWQKLKFIFLHFKQIQDFRRFVLKVLLSKTRQHMTKEFNSSKGGGDLSHYISHP